MASARRLLGHDNAIEMEAPTMAAEDFSYYGQRVPASFIFLGVRNESIGASESLHSPKFVLDERALPIGAALHASLALDFLRGIH